MLTEKVAINHHPLASSATMKNSLIDWVATFQTLPKFPANIPEFVTSGTLYMIMEEIEPTYFKQFPYSVLPKNEAKSVLEESALKKIYKHMVQKMQDWFQEKHDDKGDNNCFRF